MPGRMKRSGDLLPLHILKLCVGVDDMPYLKALQKARLKAMRDRGEKPRLMHVTRMFPRRAAQVLDGGSLYWVIKGMIQVRQRILALEEVITEDGIRKCGIVLDRKLVETEWRPRRPHQGWRYFLDEDAPPDRAAGPDADDRLPEDMERELRTLGLI